MLYGAEVAVCSEINTKQTNNADKSLARPTSRCILFDGENILSDASFVTYIEIVLIFLQL